MKLDYVVMSVCDDMQGIAFYVRLSVQDVVDDAEDGDMGPRHTIRDSILDY